MNLTRLTLKNPNQIKAFSFLGIDSAFIFLLLYPVKKRPSPLSGTGLKPNSIFFFV